MIKSGLARRMGAALLLAACSKSAPPAAAPPPPEVRIVVVASQPIASSIELPGRLQAMRTSEVRARVDGIIQRRLYTEGTDVRAGQPLFAIDRGRCARRSTRPRPRSRAPRRPPPTRNRTSLGTRDSSRSRRSASRSTTPPSRACAPRRPTSRRTRAQIAAARLNLSYTTVTAPIAGRAGRAEVTEGALVSGGQATLLTRIEQLDPIFANFSQSSSAVLASAPRLASGAADGTDHQRPRAPRARGRHARTASPGTSTSST